MIRLRNVGCPPERLGKTFATADERIQKLLVMIVRRCE